MTDPQYEEFLDEAVAVVLAAWRDRDGTLFRVQDYQDLSDHIDVFFRHMFQKVRRADGHK